MNARFLTSRFLFCALALTLLLSLVPAPQPVVAATGIQRCQSPDGNLVYTDRGCAAFQARSVPMSGELLARIAQEQARAERNQLFADIDLADSDDSGIADASLPLQDAGTLIGRRSVAGGCARTPTQLQMDLRTALALGDVNRVAESYHWVGMSSRQGERTLDRLQHLTGKPVRDSQYFDAQIGFGTGAGSLLASADSNGNRGGDAGVLQLLLGSAAAPSVVEFDVHRYAGCYFVAF